MKNAFRKISIQLHNNDSGESVETSFREHFGTSHGTLCKCTKQNTFPVCRGKTTYCISRFFFLPTCKIVMHAFELLFMLNKGGYHRLAFIVSD